MSNRGKKIPKQGKRTGRQPGRKASTQSWTLPTVLSLVVGAIGALGVIELRPQLNASPQEQLASGEPFSAPVEITNTGYLGIHIDYVTVLFPRIEYPTQLRAYDSSTNDPDWDDFDLERGQAKTILPSFANGLPKLANMVIAVDYTYFGISGRWWFRFEGMHADKWEWTKQPVRDTEKAEFDKQIEISLSKHRKALALQKPN